MGLMGKSESVGLAIAGLDQPNKPSPKAVIDRMVGIAHHGTKLVDKCPSYQPNRPGSAGRLRFGSGTSDWER